MNPIVTFRISLSSLGANKLRSGLTLLGIVIGVSAVISLMAIGQGVQQSITSRIESLGTNLLFVQPGESVQQGGLGGGGWQRLHPYPGGRSRLGRPGLRPHRKSGGAGNPILGPGYGGT